MSVVTKLVRGVLCAIILAAPFKAIAQVNNQPGVEESTAILDTAVLFAIGAREAEQAIRGSFGWPTFQEGFVEGVYFRFDPDGYARFSPSPRLDEDVFEILCAEASTACVAKKGVMDVGLTAAGQVQIKINGITPNDSFYVSDRKSELPLPPSVFGPLDPRLEALLAGGGELIVKREVETVQSVSLAGFSAVATYLRWVAQRQSPRVFPRGWPVPAQSQNQFVSGLTQPNQWVSPNVGPQAVETTWHNRQLPQPVSGASQISGSNPTDVAANTQVDFLQQQILQLQNNLLQLQSAASLAEAGNNAGLTLAGSFPRETQLRDFGQSFAEQAQGRSLPASPGGLGVGGDSRSSFNQGTVWPNTGSANGYNQAAVVGQQTGAWSQESAANQQNLMRRLESVERSLLDLRRDVSIQILELKDIIHARAQNPMPSSTIATGMTVQTQLPDTRGVTTGEIGNDPASILEELEKTLLNRLSSQTQGALTTDSQNAAMNPNGISLNRQLVEEILAELGQSGGSGVQELETGLETQSTGTAQPASESGDFVTLSDYINQVLGQEGLEARDPGR